MKAALEENRKNQILKNYSYEVSDVEQITPNMWDRVKKNSPVSVNLTLEDIKDLNIVKIAFIEGTTLEIQSIGGTASRMMVLPVQSDLKGVFKDLIRETTVH